jgi:hypothetical protein
MYKKIFTLLNCIVLACSVYAQNKNVTFQVSNPDSTPVFIFGSWSNFGNWPGNQMTQVGSGKYTITLPLAANATYEYLFVNGNAPFAKEILNPSGTCTNGNSTFTNRVLNLGANDTALCYEFATCNTCAITPPPPTVTVSFRVQNPDSTPVYVFGSWTGFGNWPGDLMTDANNDSIYEKDLILPSNSNYEYLFVNGATIYTKEALNPAWPCTNGNGQYTNRVLTVGSSNLVACNYWERCDTCGATIIPNISVDFVVENPDSTPVYLFGSWTGFGNWPGDLMTNLSPGKYKATVNLPENTTVEYLYVNGSVPAKEVLDPMWPCTNGNAQFTNRILTLGNTPSTVCHLFATCNACSTTGINEFGDDELSVSLSSNFITIKSKITQGLDEIEIFDLQGKRLFNQNSDIITNSSIPLNLIQNNLYLVRLRSGNNYFTSKQLAKE